MSTEPALSEIFKMKREISGFGGGYEKACRDMLVAGLKWLAEHPDANPTFSGYKNIYGVIQENNEDAKAMSRAIVDSVGDCTGAMHQAVITSCLWIRQNGLDKYLFTMNKEEN